MNKIWTFLFALILIFGATSNARAIPIHSGPWGGGGIEVPGGFEGAFEFASNSIIRTLTNTSPFGNGIFAAGFGLPMPPMPGEDDEFFSGVVPRGTPPVIFGGIELPPVCPDHGSDKDPGLPVPEPATMLLFGIGLFGLAAFGRKKFQGHE